MLTDVLLAIAHFLLIFVVLAALVLEMAVIRPDMTAATLRRAGFADIVYGISAGLLVIVGFARVFFGLKGPEFYFASHAFWTKIALIVAIGLISIRPTLRIIAWRRRAVGEPGFLPPADEVKGVRTLIHIELTLFFLIPIFAVLMASGLG
jgi:putative membrane protein